MTWECLVEGKNFITDLGEDKLSSGRESNRFAVWIPDSVNEGKHRMVEIGFNLNANFPGSVILNCVFGFTKLGFPYKINVFRTFLLKMCGFFAILIE